MALVPSNGKPETVKIIDLNSFKDKNGLSSAFSRSSILLQDNVSVDFFEPLNNIYIGRYRDVQESTVCLEKNSAIEIRI
jgi:hypothetical protein